jgi:hypothetical protein
MVSISSTALGSCLLENPEEVLRLSLGISIKSFVRYSYFWVAVTGHRAVL